MDTSIFLFGPHELAFKLGHVVDAQANAPPLTWARRLKGVWQQSTGEWKDDGRKRGCMKVVVLVAAHYQSGSVLGNNGYTVPLQRREN